MFVYKDTLLTSIISVISHLKLTFPGIKAPLSTGVIKLTLGFTNSINPAGCIVKLLFEIIDGFILALKFNSGFGPLPSSSINHFTFHVTFAVPFIKVAFVGKPNSELFIKSSGQNVSS